MKGPALIPDKDTDGGGSLLAKGGGKLWLAGSIGDVTPLDVAREEYAVTDG